jgi:flavin-dependent dehydrogenase
MANPSSDQRQRVVVIGGRIAANLASAYLRKKHPDLEVVAIDRPDAKAPLVGESTIEGTTLFLHECGLSNLLQEKHFHKFGLTFYFKLKSDDPGDRRYSIHEEPAIPPLPAALVNRFTFDRDVRAINVANGVRYEVGTVTNVAIRRPLHVVTYRDRGGAVQSIEARWVIDASGRHRVLAKELGLTERGAYQRSSFWFRLADFDPQILLGLNTEMRAQHRSMREQIAYDPYFVTHHFMGRGNWIWCIPVSTEDGQKLISVGITYRPDVYPFGTVRSVDDFLCNVDKEHPIIAQLVRSGRVTDTNLLLGYMYHTRQHYSPDGWFILGDAANAVDPLYSSGLFLLSIQIMQSCAIIDADRRGILDPNYVTDLDAMIKTLYGRTQTIIARHYEVMQDPVQSALRMHWLTTSYFYFGLPFFICGYHTDPRGVRLMTRMMAESESRELSAWELFAHASAKLAEPRIEDIFNWYNDTINYRLFTNNETELPLHLARMAFLSARIRLATLRQARWTHALRHLGAIATDALTALLFGTAFRGVCLRRSEAFRRLLAA